MRLYGNVRLGSGEKGERAFFWDEGEIHGGPGLIPRGAAAHFDEPTSGLDPVSRDDLLTLFQALVKDGKRSILYSTHITSDLDKCADDISYIKDGKLLRSAEKSEFIRSFQHLQQEDEKGELTLEEIMIRTERMSYHV